MRSASLGAPLPATAARREERRGERAAPQQTAQERPTTHRDSALAQVARACQEDRLGGLQQLRAGGSLPWVAMVPYRRCCPAGRTEAACSVRRARRVRASKPSRPACWTRPAARLAVPGTTRAQRRQAIWSGAVRCWRRKVSRSLLKISTAKTARFQNQEHNVPYDSSSCLISGR